MPKGKKARKADVIGVANVRVMQIGHGRFDCKGFGVQGRQSSTAKLTAAAAVGHCQEFDWGKPNTRFNEERESAHHPGKGVSVFCF